VQRVVDFASGQNLLAHDSFLCLYNM